MINKDFNKDDFINLLFTAVPHIFRIYSQCLNFELLTPYIKKGSSLTDSGKDPNFPRRDAMDPPETNSSNIFNESSSLTVPKYL